MKRLMWIALTLALTACGTGPCRGTAAAKGPQKGDVTVTAPTSSADHVKVYKPDGSLQCGQGKQIL